MLRNIISAVWKKFLKILLLYLYVDLFHLLKQAIQHKGKNITQENGYTVQGDSNFQTSPAINKA